MASGRNSDMAGIVALALAFHRAPTQHADLLHGRTPLPPDVDTLLKLAGGSAPDPAYAALASPDELKAAAMFFIEQALFHHDVSHYRVLGLEPGASLDRIKEHHRLLMRVFHPDRDNHADDWKSAFAARINLAYTNLRDPDARQRHDAALKQTARPGSPPQAARRRVAPAHRPAARVSSARGLPPMVQRYLPQWVLAGTALVAFGVVGSIYLENLPAHTVAVEASAPPAAPMHETVAALAPVVEKVIAAAEDTQPPPAAEAPPQPPSSIPAPAPMATLVPAPGPKPAPAQVQTPPRAMPVQVATRPMPLKVPAPPNRATVSRPAPATVPQSADGRAAKEAAGFAPAPVPAQPRDEPVLKKLADIAPVPVPRPEAAAPTAAQPAARTTEVAALPAQADPNATLAQFRASYERGDTQAFMALFDEVAIGSAGGKSMIRRQHDSLFRSTDLRHIAIDGMAWSQQGDWIRGEGRYRKTLMPKGELKLQTETGIIRIELLRQGERALIMALDYQPGGRS
jgi:hypothetical protein